MIFGFKIRTPSDRVDNPSAQVYFIGLCRPFLPRVICEALSGGRPTITSSPTRSSTIFIGTRPSASSPNRTEPIELSTSPHPLSLSSVSLTRKILQNRFIDNFFFGGGGGMSEKLFFKLYQQYIIRCPLHSFTPCSSIGNKCLLFFFFREII
jgi:hypothetical protein